VNIILN